MNPLKTMKNPRSVAGECIDGKCLKCNVELDPRRANRKTIASSPSFHSRSTQSFGGASFSSLSSLESFDSENTHLPLARLQSQQSSDSWNTRRARLPPQPNRSNPSCLTQRGGASCDYETTNKSFRFSQKSSYPPELTLSKNSSFNSSRSDNNWVRYKGESSRSVASLQSEASDGLSTAVEINHQDTLVDCELNDLFGDLKKIGCLEILSETILTSMKTHSSDEKALASCLSTITDIFEDEEKFDSSKFVKAGGGSSIVEVMKKFPSSLKLQEHGCAAIGILARSEFNRNYLIGAGSCVAILKGVSQHFGDASLVTSAFVAIRIFSTELQGRNELIRIAASKTVVEAMQCNISIAAIQIDGCAILSNLAVDAESKTVSKVSMSEIAIIVKVMHVHQDEETVIASSCFALKNLSYNQDNLRSISKSENILDALERATIFSSILSVEDTMEKIFLSRAQDESLEEATIKTLKEKVDFSAFESLGNPDIINVLLETLIQFHWSLDVVTQCLKYIRALTTTSEQHRRVFLNHDKTSQIYIILKDFESNSDVQEQLSTLKNLCDSDEAILENRCFI
jgi:hypothetical protein